MAAPTNAALLQKVLANRSRPHMAHGGDELDWSAIGLVVEDAGEEGSRLYKEKPRKARTEINCDSESNITTYNCCESS